MLIYGSGVLTTLSNGQPVAPQETQSNQVGPGFASVTIMNESPWSLEFVNANAGSFPITPWAVASIPVSPGDSWHISPQQPLFISGNYLMPPGVASSQTQVVAQFSRTPTAYSIRELFTISATEITGTTQVTIDTSGGAVDVSGTVAISGGTIDLASGTTVDANITNATLDVSGPVSITTGSQGNTGLSVQVIDERPTAVEAISGNVSLGNPLTLIAAPGAGKQLAIYKVKLWPANSLLDNSTALDFQLTGLEGGDPYVQMNLFIVNINSGTATYWSWHKLEEDFGGLLGIADTAFALVMSTSSVTVPILGYVTYSVVG